MAHHGHHHEQRHQGQRALTIAIVITSLFVLAEFVGGLLTNSLALLADAGHMFSDVVALALSLFAVRLASRPPTQRHSFGYHRSEVLAALLNGAALVVIALLIVVEAIERISNPVEVNAIPMLAVAVAGLFANLASAWVLSHGGNGLNIRGAMLHVLADALGSVAAITAGAIIALTGWLLADPLLSMVTTLLIGWGAVRLIRDTVHVLMEGVPSEMDLEEVRGAIEDVEGVSGVHDLHIWSVTSGIHAMSGHVQVERTSLYNPTPLLLRLQEMLACRFGIHHTTIQLEPLSFFEHEELHLQCSTEGCWLTRRERHEAHGAHNHEPPPLTVKQVGGRREPE